MGEWRETGWADGWVDASMKGQVRQGLWEEHKVQKKTQLKECNSCSSKLMIIPV